MSSTTKRLIAAVAVFAVLLVAVLVVANRQGPEDASDEEPIGPPLPEISKDDVTRLQVLHPDGSDVVLTRTDGGWRLTAPLEAAANDNLVELALNKLAEMPGADTGIAATKASNHERLEVAESNGTQVIIQAKGEKLAHLFVGAYKGGNTMVRLAGQEPVHAVKGSLASNFEREVDDWRDKRIVDRTATDVKELHFESDNGTFLFVRGDDDQWKLAEDQAETEEWDPAQVQSIASTLARMRAVGFAEPHVTREMAGLGEGSSTATLLMQAEGEDPARIVLRLGNALESNERFYLVREGRNPIFVISKHLAERVAPKAETFKKPEAPEGKEPAPGSKSRPLTKHQLESLMKQIQKKPVRLSP